MELEFDKEIDAILRKRGGGTAAAAVVSPHADADTIAAFAENVLPQKAKLLYIEHFADCDRCRQMLSHSVLLNSEAVTASAGAASTSVGAPVSETVVPWYQKLFRTPNLVLAMGALVLAFGGLLGYLALQRQGDSGNMTVSQTARDERVPGGPYLGDESETQPSAPANTAAAAPLNANAVQANRSANIAAVPAATPSSNMSAGMFRPGSPMDTVAGADRDAGKPEAAAPPPPPVTIDGTSREIDEKKLDDKRKDKELPKDLELAKNRRAEEMRSRDLPPAPAKAGPSRAATGPLQNQSNQTNNNVFDMSVTRSVGGKTFDNRERVWYDSTYRGQATVNIRRGTDDFKKLDDGLRNIANTLGGTVVIVWKGKAYRIS